MTTPDYPLMAPGGYETYQLAQIATFVAERLARHRTARRGRAGVPDRAQAVRDLALAATALDAAGGAVEPGPNGELLPRPLDAATYAEARGLLTPGHRWADVVSMAPAGGTGWAVIGNVPGVGPVGAQVATRAMAEGLMAHVLTMPAAAVAPWVVVREPVAVPTLPKQIDLAAAVEYLDPGCSEHRAVAAAMRGVDRRTDLAIRKRFRGVDLDAPQAAVPPAPGPSPSARTVAAPSRHTPAAATASPPMMNAGP